jgi:hypothetical protein
VDCGLISITGHIVNLDDYIFNKPILVLNIDAGCRVIVVTFTMNWKFSQLTRKGKQIVDVEGFLSSNLCPLYKKSCLL